MIIRLFRIKKITNLANPDLSFPSIRKLSDLRLWANQLAIMHIIADVCGYTLRGRHFKTSLQNNNI